MKKIIKSKDGCSFWDLTYYLGMEVAQSSDEMWSVVVRYVDGSTGCIGQYPTEDDAMEVLNELQDFIFSYDDVYVMP